MHSVDKAYLAGLIDGEGTITLCRESDTAFRYPVISVVSTSPELVNWCSIVTDIGHISSKIIQKEGHTPSYVWKISHRAAIDLMRELMPYLKEREKFRRAQLIVENWDKVTMRNGKYSNTQIANKIAFEKEFFKNSRKLF